MRVPKFPYNTFLQYESISLDIYRQEIISLLFVVLPLTVLLA